MAFILTEPIGKDAELDLIAALSDLTEKNLKPIEVSPETEPADKEAKPEAAAAAAAGEPTDKDAKPEAVPASSEPAKKDNASEPSSPLAEMADELRSLGALLGVDKDAGSTLAAGADKVKPDWDKVSDHLVPMDSSSSAESGSKTSVVESAVDAADDALASKRRAEYEGDE